MSDSSDYTSSTDNISTDESSLTQGFSDYERSSFYKELSEDDKTMYRKTLLYIQKLTLNDNTIDIYNVIEKFNNIKNDLKDIIKKSKKPELNNVVNSLDDDAILYMIIMYTAILNNADVSFVYEDADGETGIDKYISLLQELIVSNEILRKNSIFSMNNAYTLFNIKPSQTEKILPIKRILRNCDLVLRSKNDFGFSNLTFPLSTKDTGSTSLIKPRRFSKDIPVISMNEKYVKPDDSDVEYTDDQIKQRIQKARDENKKEVQKYWEDVLAKQKSSKKDKGKKSITYFSYDKQVSNIEELIDYYTDNLQKFVKTNELISELRDNLLNLDNSKLSKEVIEVQQKFKGDYFLIYKKRYVDENDTKVKNLNKSISWVDNIPKGINKSAVKEYRKWYNMYFNTVLQDKSDVEWFKDVVNIEPTMNEAVFDKKFKMVVDSAYKKYLARKKDEERRAKMNAFRSSSQFKTIRKESDESDSEELSTEPTTTRKKSVTSVSESDENISETLKKLINKKTNSSSEDSSDDSTTTSDSSSDDSSLSNKTAKTEQTEIADKTEMTDKTAKTEMTDKTEMTEQTAKTEKTDKTEKTKKKSDDDDLSSFFRQMNINDKKEDTTDSDISSEFFSKDGKTGKDGLKLKELQEMCRKMKLKVSGKKEELCERIRKHFSIPSDLSEGSSIAESSAESKKIQLGSGKKSRKSNVSEVRDFLQKNKK